MAHKKSKKVWWCHSRQAYIMASYCNKCSLVGWSGNECSEGNLFNSCKLISEKNQKDIDKALK